MDKILVLEFKNKNFKIVFFLVHFNKIILVTMINSYYV
jgi:hypothetical protein